MKIVLSVRSDIAYKLLTKLLSREESLPDLEFQSRNASTLQDLEDAIEFYAADVYIVDRQLEDAETLIEVLKKANLEYMVIENDVKAILPIFRERYGEKEEVQEIHYEREKRQKIVVQEKIIEKEIIRTQFQAIPSRVVVVGSLYQGAGSTMLSSNLARMVAVRGIDVSYVEHPLIKPYMFDYLQIQDSPYVDASREIHDEGLFRSKRDGWIKNGVKWHVIDSRKPPLTSFTYENLLVLSHAVQSNVIIIDISNRWLDEDVQRFLYLASSILVCVEPNPIKYERSLLNIPNYQHDERKIMDFLNNTKELSKYELVLMKDGKGMDAKIIKEMLHKRPIATVPYIPYHETLNAMYNIKLLYDFEQNAHVFEDTLIPVISKFIPYDFVELKKDKKGFLKNLFKKSE